jgi:hypothetical protein
VFTARYALSRYIKEIHFVFKGLILQLKPSKCAIIVHSLLSLLVLQHVSADRHLQAGVRKLLHTTFKTSQCCVGVNTQIFLETFLQRVKILCFLTWIARWHFVGAVGWLANYVFIYG